MNQSKKELRTKIDEWFDKNFRELIADLSRLIAIESVRGTAIDGAPYGEGPKAALMLVKSMLEDKGFDVTNFEDIVISADINDKPAELGILAHVDVVSAVGQWQSDPYEMTIRDGKIFGRGATDNKGPAIAAMYAMYAAHDIAPDLTKGFRIILGSGEECGCEDVDRYVKENAPPRYSFTPDANYPLVNTEKGRYVPYFSAKWQEDTALPRVTSIVGGDTANIVPNISTAKLEGMTLEDASRFCKEYSDLTNAKITCNQTGDTIYITSKGVSAHASRPKDGLNAQTALVAMLANMPLADSEGTRAVKSLAKLFPHGSDNGDGLGICMQDHTGELTLNFGMLEFNLTGFSANFDSRTPACADETDIIGTTAKAFAEHGIKQKSQTRTMCHHTPDDSPFVRSLLDIYEEYTDDTGKCLAIGGTTYVHNIPGGVAFGCEFPGVDNKIHGVDEFITIPQLLLSAKMFTHAIIEMCR